MMSAKLTPAAATLIRTSLSPGSGATASRTSRTSGGPWRVIHTWRMVSGDAVMQLSRWRLLPHSISNCFQLRITRPVHVGCRKLRDDIVAVRQWRYKSGSSIYDGNRAFT